MDAINRQKKILKKFFKNLLTNGKMCIIIPKHEKKVRCSARVIEDGNCFYPPFFCFISLGNCGLFTCFCKRIRNVWGESSERYV